MKMAPKDVVNTEQTFVVDCVTVKNASQG